MTSSAIKRTRQSSYTHLTGSLCPECTTHSTRRYLQTPKNLSTLSNKPSWDSCLCTGKLKRYPSRNTRKRQLEKISKSVYRSRKRMLSCLLLTRLKKKIEISWPLMRSSQEQRRLREKTLTYFSLDTWASTNRKASRPLQNSLHFCTSRDNCPLQVRLLEKKKKSLPLRISTNCS